MSTISNAEISKQLSLLSDLMELHGQNSFRAKSYSIAAFQVKKLDAPLADKKPAEIYELKYIGESVGKKIVELIENNRITVLDSLLEQTPKGIIELLQVKGLGPKKVALLWTTLGIENISDLELAAVENRLRNLKGFGLKIQEKILESIAFIRNSQGFALLVHAWAMWQQLNQWLQQQFPNNRFESVGALRRKEDVLSVLEILTTADLIEIQKAAEQWENTEIHYEENRLQLNKEAWLPMVFYATTEKERVEKLFQLTGDEPFISAFNSQFRIPKNVKDETEIFTHNQLAFVVPELRHGEKILKNAQQNNVPSLIEYSDIKGLIHCHSTWSDGTATVEDMAKACIKKGWQYMVMSDHSKTAFYANGLPVERVIAQHLEINELNKKLAPFKIFKSIESDILNDGSLDYDDEVLSSFDLVIASIHSNLSMSEDLAMTRLLKAIENKHTRIMGHLTGRLLLSRPGYPIDHRKIIDACAAQGVVIEINANPRRLDMDWTFISYAMEKGVMLSINPDAHSIHGIDDVQWGVWSARKGGLSKTFNLSSFSLYEMEKFVAQKRI